MARPASRLRETRCRVRRAAGAAPKDLTPEQAARNCRTCGTTALQPVSKVHGADKLDQRAAPRIELLDQHLHAAHELDRHVNAFKQGPAGLLEQCPVVRSCVGIRGGHFVAAVAALRLRQVLVGEPNDGELHASAGVRDAPALAQHRSLVVHAAQHVGVVNAVERMVSERAAPRDWRPTRGNGCPGCPSRHVAGAMRKPDRGRSVSTVSQPDSVARRSAGHPEPAPSSSRRRPRPSWRRAAACSAWSRVVQLVAP